MTFVIAAVTMFVNVLYVCQIAINQNTDIGHCFNSTVRCFNSTVCVHFFVLYMLFVVNMQSLSHKLYLRKMYSMKVQGNPMK